MTRLVTVTYRGARRIVILVVGSTVFLLGVVMIALPGPGSLVILGGLSLLAVEFAWARRWLKSFRDASAGVGRYVSRTFGRAAKAELPGKEP